MKEQLAALLQSYCITVKRIDYDGSYVVIEIASETDRRLASFILSEHAVAYEYARNYDRAFYVKKEVA
jgi:hypothetical protein